MQHTKNERISFEEFKSMITEAISSGAINISAPLNELDLAIAYATSRACEEKGSDITATPYEIAGFIRKYCGDEVYERVLGGEA